MNEFILSTGELVLGSTAFSRTNRYVSGTRNLRSGRTLGSFRPFPEETVSSVYKKRFLSSFLETTSGVIYSNYLIKGRVCFYCRQPNIWVMAFCLGIDDCKGVWHGSKIVCGEPVLYDDRTKSA
jgi:hypothetical protein